MIDKQAISKRFFLCYHDKSRRELAKLLGVKKPTVTQWATDGRVPWRRLNYLSGSQAVSWDWLIDGMEPKGSIKAAIVPSSTKPEFDKNGINKRFLSLFANMTQTQIAKIFDITPAAVNEWDAGTHQVPWNRLDYAVHTFAVRWDWLLDGLEPKYREREE